MADNPFVPGAFSGRPFWLAVLDKWLNLLNEYESLNPSEPDLAYWYGERPLTGFLGAAAWQIGGWSLEEFGAGRSRKKTGETCQGRGDLWLGCTRGAVTAECTVEAKILWVYQNDLDAVKTGLDDKLKRARKQLRQLALVDRVGDPFSVCYVVPCYAGSKSKERGLKLLTQLGEDVRRKEMAAAAHFATIGNITDIEYGERRSYPGVLLVARQEHWRDG